MSSSLKTVGGPAAIALGTLTPPQIRFLQSVPKAELHAHMNGSIPLDTLQELAAEYLAVRRGDSGSMDSNTMIGTDNATKGIGGATGTGNTPPISDASLISGIETLMRGPVLDKIDDFFGLFPAIYALTSTPDALGRTTRAVLRTFLEPLPTAHEGGILTSTPPQAAAPQCTYLELRSTPRATPHMDRELYLLTILSEMASYTPDQVGLIISLDRRMGVDVVQDCLRIACKLRAGGRGEIGRRVVGVDLCGDPLVGDVGLFEPYFEEARRVGLGVTVHIAETLQNTPEETLQLLSYNPDRLGHATFLNDEAISIVLERKTCIEICLSSNLLCKTVSTLDSHHILQYLKAGHPISICTDDILPFRTSLLAEYALLLAKPPYGLGLSEEQVLTIGKMSLNARFK